MKRMTTGIKPTGSFPHIANLLGGMLPIRNLASQYDTSIFIADLHAITTVRDGSELRANIRNILIAYLSVLGRDTSVVLYQQSAIEGLAKLSWILHCFTPYSLMLRAHAVKDAEGTGRDLNMGVFTYPILMAADILGYDIDVVPVGRDQLQHLEMARDIARYVNHHYQSEILVEPTAIIDDAVAVVPGLDGRKMSKSHDNYISMFESSPDLKKKIATIPTDSLPLESPKNPDTCHIFALIKTFGMPDEIDDIRNKYLKGGYGYGHAKESLFIILDRYIEPYRRSYAELSVLTDDELFAPVRKGNAIMQERMNMTLARMREFVGV